MADPKLVAGPITPKMMLARMAALAQSLILHRAFTSGEVSKSVRDAPVKALGKKYEWYKSGTYPYKGAETKQAAAIRRGSGTIKAKRATRPKRPKFRVSSPSAMKMAKAFVRRAKAKTMRGLGIRKARQPSEAQLDQLTRDRLIASARAAGKRPVVYGPFGWGPIAYTEGGRKRLGARSTVADQVLSGGTRQAFGKVRESANSITLGFRTARSQEVATHLQKRNEFFPLTPDERAAVLKLGDQHLQEIAKKITLRGSTISVVL